MKHNLLTIIAVAGGVAVTMSSCAGMWTDLGVGGVTFYDDPNYPPPPIYGQPLPPALLAPGWSIPIDRPPYPGGPGPVRPPYPGQQWPEGPNRPSQPNRPNPGGPGNNVPDRPNQGPGNEQPSRPSNGGYRPGANTIRPIGGGGGTSTPGGNTGGGSHTGGGGRQGGGRR